MEPSDDTGTRCGRSAVSLALLVSAALFWGSLITLSVVSTLGWGMVIAWSLLIGLGAFAAIFGILYVVYRIRRGGEAAPAGAGHHEDSTSTSRS